MARSKAGKVFTERLRRWARPLSMMSRDHLCALWVDPPFLSFFLFSPLLLLTAILLVIGWWRSKQCSQCQFCIFPGPSLSVFLFSGLQLLCSLQYNWWKDGEGPNNAVKRQFCICYKNKHIETNVAFWTLPSSFIAMPCTFQSVALGAKKVDRCVARYFLVLRKYFLSLNICYTTIFSGPFLIIKVVRTRSFLMDH